MFVQPYRRLTDYLGIASAEQYLHGWPGSGIVAMDEAVLGRLGSDVRGVWDRVLVRDHGQSDGQVSVDAWGVGHRETGLEGFGPVLHPLADVTDPDVIEQYAWPDMTHPDLYTAAGVRARYLAAEGQYAVVGAPWLVAPLERASQLQGREQVLVNMLRYPEWASALLRKVTGVCMAQLKGFLAAVGDILDLIMIGDDLGTQSGLLLSPRLYRAMLKPLHADLVAVVKAQSAARVVFHTDGDVFALLDDLVEIGIDVLSPVESTAGDMADLPRLKRRYGHNLVFCGALDTQHILPLGNPDDVRREVRRVSQALGPGFMLAPTYTIMDAVPPQNVLAMSDAIMESGR
ncbi:MAG: hypothetical protein GYB65_14725 [Chloroflexi bacterium]|nr:hypothetical protein [Chloroflexota bacterium]